MVRIHARLRVWPRTYYMAGRGGCFRVSWPQLAPQRASSARSATRGGTGRERLLRVARVAVASVGYLDSHPSQAAGEEG